MRNKTNKDLRLYVLRVLYLLLPSIYLLIRMHIVSLGSVDINILGQIEWFDLIDEVLATGLTVPLYSLLKPETGKKYSGFACVLSVIIYTLFAGIVFLNIQGITAYMQAENAAQYLTMQMASMMAGFVSTLMVLLFTLYADTKFFVVILIAKLAMQIGLDYILIPKYAELGASYSEIIGNVGVSALTLGLATGHGYLKWHMPNIQFIRTWLWRMVCAGAQIFLDNFIYAVMVCKMVNAVSETGRYWVANNFIWGWLLIPVSCFGEIIRKNTEDAIKKKSTWKCVGAILALWVLTAPFWGWFMEYGMASDRTIVRDIVFPLMPFYVFYMLTIVLDSWFISIGKLWCNTVNSIIVNIGYYGIVYALFRCGVFAPSMQFVICMFGFGMVVHFFVSAGLYRWIKKKEKYSDGNRETYSS